MLRTRVMPCLLVDEGRLVKTIKFKKPQYVGDPVNAIKIYNEKEVDELILLDITATIQKRFPDLDLLKTVVDECFMPLCYGGGVTDIKTMNKLFNIGIEKIAINSFAAENPDFVANAASKFGNQSIVISIDVKKSLLGKYNVYTKVIKI